MQRSLLAALALSTALISAPALAQQAGDFMVGVGVGGVFPKDDNGTLANGTLPIEVGNSVRPTLTGTWFFTDNLGIELLAAWPFKHSIDVDGVGEVGDVTHLPPTLSLVYHFTNNSAFTPFAGVGVNYTIAYDTDLNLVGQSVLGVGPNALNLDNSFGIAGLLGVDYALNDRGALRAEVRYADIDLDAELNGLPVGTVEVDPFIFNVAYVFKF